MKSKTREYADDQLLHTIWHENYDSNIHFMYFKHPKFYSNHVITGLLQNLSDEIAVKPTDYITCYGVEQSIMG